MAPKLSTYAKPSAALAAAAIVAVMGAILWGAFPEKANSSRVLVDAYCDDGDGGKAAFTLDIRVPPATPVDGGWVVDGDGGPIFVTSLDEWADKIEARSDCTLIRESRRVDPADANSWPAQAVEVRKRALTLGCWCGAVDGKDGGNIPIPCNHNAGHEVIAREYGCAKNANTMEITP